MADEIKRIQTRIIIKNDTEELWASSNPVLLKGEIGISIDKNKLKIGDGTKTWSELSYMGITPDEIGDLIDAEKDAVYTYTKAATTETDEDAIASAIGTNAAKQADMCIIKTPISDAEGNDKFSYTAYVYSGTPSVGINGWIAMDGNVSAKNVLITNDITLAGNYTSVGCVTKASNAATGTIEVGDGLSIEDLITKIFTKVEQPKITAQPSVSITASTNKAYEVGTTVTPSYTATFNKGSYSYGPDTGLTPTWEVTDTNGSTAKTTATGSFDAITVADNTNYKITAKATYGDGAVALTNVKTPSNPVIKIAGGSKSATSTAITGYRAWFTYVGTDNTSTINSAFIRGGVNRANANYNILKGSTNTGITTDKGLIIPDGTKRVVIAIPASASKNLSSVIDVDGMGLDVKDNFTKITVAVEGANGASAVNYDVFYVENAAGLKPTGYKITLS